MTKSITRIILEKTAELGMITLDIFFPPNYSYTRVSRKLFGLDNYPETSSPTISTLLCRLRRQGLVIRKGSNRSSVWRISKKGKVWLAKQKLVKVIPKKDGIPRLVIFDIPERERRKRNILRAELMGYGFERLQKSVWLGYNPLPEDFVRMLEVQSLKNKVHIFSIRDVGTLSSPKGFS